MKTRAFVLCVTTSLLLPTLAFAQEPSADHRARAQQLFESALADAERGDFAHACPKFLASQAADPKASTLLNLANCYEKNHQPASAWGAYREAESLARKTNHADWEANAKARAAALEPTLNHLTITVGETSKVPGLVVSRDGAKLEAGEWGVAIPVDPGEHVIAASADGYISIEKKLEVKEGDATFEVPALEKLPPPPVEPPPPPLTLPKGFPSADKPYPKARWSTLEIAGLTMAGVGALGVAGGGLMALVAAGNYDAAAAHCTNGTHGCDPNAVETANNAYDLAAMATATMITGVALIGAGALLIILSPSEKKLARAPRAVLAW
ncbi:MAG: hypothetical protein U0270_00085 [Labilithrix sp.]